MVLVFDSVEVAVGFIFLGGAQSIFGELVVRMINPSDKYTYSKTYCQILI